MAFKLINNTAVVSKRVRLLLWCVQISDSSDDYKRNIELKGN